MCVHVIPWFSHSFGRPVFLGKGGHECFVLPPVVCFPHFVSYSFPQLQISQYISLNLCSQLPKLQVKHSYQFVASGFSAVVSSSCSIACCSLSMPVSKFGSFSLIRNLSSLLSSRKIVDFQLHRFFCKKVDDSYAHICQSQNHQSETLFK